MQTIHYFVCIDANYSSAGSFPSYLARNTNCIFSSLQHVSAFSCCARLGRVDIWKKPRPSYFLPLVLSRLRLTREINRGFKGLPPGV